MYMLKLSFQKLEIRPILSWLLGKQLTSWGTAKDYHLGQVETSGLLCSRERLRTTRPWEQLTAQGRNVAASFT